MAPTPLTANYRLTFLYTASGFQHKAQNYLGCAVSADPSGFDMVPRGVFAALGVSTLHTRFFTVIAPFFNPARDSFDGWLLQLRSGTTWVYVSSNVTAVVPVGASTASPAMGYCVSGKDTANMRMPAYIYEGAFGSTQKNSSYAALNAANKAVQDYYFNPGGVAINSDAWAWRVARGGAFAHRWLASVVDSNEKLRRLRRIK